MNTGLLAAIVQEKMASWVTFGHDHCNSFYSTIKNVTLSYGRKSGYGSYNCEKYNAEYLSKGARVFELT